MPEDQDTTGREETPEGVGSDPLGIVGWEVAGKYKIRTHIGGGGFGEVYEGYNINLPEQRLVFKFFKRVQSRDKFAKEAKILCMLDHPNISRVIDYLPDEGAVVVAYIDGKDGSRVLLESGPLPGDQFLNVARAMTDAMEYAHGKKIAHRDIKPGNIMFDRSGHIYLIDFGIAKEIGGDATKTAHQVLTPLFAAPERQSGDKGYNPFVSDIYEMGVTLYNFATNDFPYRNPANPNPKDWGGIASEKLSPRLRQILMKATNPVPSRRYQSSTEFAEEFKNLEQVYLTGETKRRSFLPYAIVLIVLIAAGYFGRNEITQLWRQAYSFVKASSEETSHPISRKIEEMLASESDSTASEEFAVADTTLTGKKPGDMIPEGVEPQEPKAEPVKKEIKPAEEKPMSQKSEPAQESERERQIISKIEPADNEPEKIASIPSKIKTKEETKPIQPRTPALMPLSFQVIPEGSSMLMVDGEEIELDSTLMMKSGRYEIQIIHPDYPVFKRAVTVTDDPVDLEINLQNEFPVIDSVHLQIALSPPSGQHIIELSFNGRRHTLTEFPILDMPKLKGDWYLETNIFGIAGGEQAEPHVDSLVIFPYGGGAHAAIMGASGRINLGATGGADVESVPLLIFWSEQR